MIKISPEELRVVRMKVATLDDGRCRRVDDDGCRCLRKTHEDFGRCDFPWTPRDATLAAMKAVAR